MSKSEDKTEPDKNAIGLAGEFAVLSQLALRGYNASMTLGHTKHVDILVFDPRKNRQFRLEVKTSFSLGKKTHRSDLFGEYIHSWRMNRKHETIRDNDLWYCFVMIDEESLQARYFLVPSKKVADFVKSSHNIWLRSDPNRKDSAIRQFVIGLHGSRSEVAAPSARKYENNWGFKP